MSITNTSEELRHSLNTLGGRFYFPKRHKSTRVDKELREQVWVWRTAAAWDVHRFLSAIEPYMRIKRTKALETIAEIEAKHGVPPETESAQLRRASVIVSEALTKAVLAIGGQKTSAPPLRAGQLPLGI